MNNHMSRKGGVGIVHAAMRVAEAFAALNLCVVVPLVLATLWSAPERVECTASVRDPVRCDFGLRNGTDDSEVEWVKISNAVGRGNICYKAYFRDLINPDLLAFRFSQGLSDGVTIKRISLLKHGLWRDVLYEDEIKRCTEKLGDWLVFKSGAVPKWRMSIQSDHRVVLALGLLESLLLLFSIVFVSINPDREKVTWPAFGRATLLTLSFVVLYVWLLPLQTFLSNANVFNFTISSLVRDLLGQSLVWLVFGIVALLWLRRCFGVWFELLLLGFIWYEFLETGVLSIGLHKMEGLAMDFYNPTRGIWDGCVLVVLLVLPLVFKKHVARTFSYYAGALLILMMASGFDIRTQERDKSEGSYLKSFTSGLDVARHAVLSRDRNVFVLMLDSTRTDVCSDVFSSDASLREKFSGFVHYVNNVGMHNGTDGGFPGLLTGKYCGEEGWLDEHMQSFIEKGSLIFPYFTAGAYVNLIPGVTTYFYSGDKNSSRRCSDFADSEFRSPFTARTQDALGYSIGQIVRFRALPFGAKEWYMAFLTLGNSKLSVSDERVLYPMLAARPVDDKCSLSLHVYITWGSHMPLRFDEHGNAVLATTEMPNYDAKSYVRIRSQMHYALKCLGDFFDALRAKGIYDQSLIIVMGDHGCYYPKVVRDSEKIPPRAFPCLLVKPFGSRACFQDSTVSTSHSKIHDMVVRSLKDNLTVAEIEQILFAPIRRYCVLETDSYKEYVFDDKPESTTSGCVPRIVAR